MVILALIAAFVAAGGAAERRPACDPLVSAATWDGATLAVAPSRCGRRAAIGDPARVLGAAVAVAGGGAPADRTVLGQLRCHAYFAPFKARWNLEAWRPAVAWPVLIATACNPPAG